MTVITVFLYLIYIYIYIYIFRAFSYNNYIFNFPTRDHYSTYHDAQGTRAEQNVTGGFLGIIQRTQIVGTEKEHILPQHYEII